MNSTRPNVKPEIPRPRNLHLNDTRRWVYIDLEEFEFNVRQEELEKYIALRRKERARKRWEREAREDLFKATIKPRLLGLFVIVLSMLIFAATHRTDDSTWMLVTIPIGLLLMAMPGNNKPKR